MRPTGALHLGNYHGALKNWTELQYQYECYFFIADIHALTTGYEDTRQLEDNVWEIVIDWLAAGLNPAASTMFTFPKPNPGNPRYDTTFHGAGTPHNVQGGLAVVTCPASGPAAAGTAKDPNGVD